MIRSFLEFLSLGFAVFMLTPPMVALCWFLFRIPNTRGFLRSPGYQLYSLWIIAALYICFAAYFYFGREGIKIAGDLFGRRMYLNIVLGSCFFSYISVVIGLPLMSYWLPVGESKLLIARVVDSDIEPARGTPCQLEISVDQDQGLFNSICVSKEFARSLKRGERVELEGIRIPYIGFHVLSVSRMPALEDHVQ